MSEDYGIKVIPDSCFPIEQYRRRNEMYARVWYAMKLLAKLPNGRAVSIPVATDTPHLISKKAHVYAKRFDMPVVTRRAGEVVIVAKRFAVKSNERTGCNTTTKSAGGVQPTKPSQALSRRAM